MANNKFKITILISLITVLSLVFFIFIFTYDPGTTDKTNTQEELTMKQDIKGLEGSDGKDFYENAICGVLETSPSEAIISESDITFNAETNKYKAEVKTNKNNEITYIKMIALTSEDNTNFFMASQRMNYNTKNAGELTSFIIKNIGKTQTTQIGNATFKFSVNENNQIILEILAN